MLQKFAKLKAEHSWLINYCIPLGCGAGGIRTLVQTSSRSAFYMLISYLIVGAGLQKSHDTTPVSPKFSLKLQGGV